MEMFRPMVVNATRYADIFYKTEGVPLIHSGIVFPGYFTPS